MSRTVALHLSYICFSMLKSQIFRFFVFLHFRFFIFLHYHIVGLSRFTCTSACAHQFSHCCWQLYVINLRMRTQRWKKSKYNNAKKTRQIIGKSTTRKMCRIVAHLLSYFDYLPKSNFDEFSHFFIVVFWGERAKTRHGVNQPPYLYDYDDDKKQYLLDINFSIINLFSPYYDNFT